MASFLAAFTGVDEEYVLSLSIMLGFGFIFNSWNAALFYRYLAE